MPSFERTPRPEKVKTVEELREIIGAGNLILMDYQGLDVKSISNLRRKLREAGSGCRVVKNNLFILAAADTPAMPLAEGLHGPTAIVHTEDPVAAAKALEAFGKEVKPVQVKAGLVEGTVLDAEQVKSLSKLPSKPELYAMVVGGLQGPIAGLVGTLQQLVGQVVFTLQAIADQKEAA